MSGLAIVLIVLGGVLGALGVTTKTTDTTGRLTTWGKTTLVLITASAIVAVWQQIATQSRDDAERKQSERRWAEQSAQMNKTLQMVTQQLALASEQLRLSNS